VDVVPYFPTSAGSAILWTGATLIVLGFPATFVYLMRPAGSVRA
jgi:hypothetical protein